MCRKNFTNKLSVSQRIYHHFLLCANICTIHGCAHAARKGISPYERILWILLIICAVGLCVPIGSEAWHRYQYRPTVISIEKEHWKWDSTFPACTLCMKTIDEHKMETLIEKMKIPENEIEDFVNFVFNLATGNIEENFGNNKYISNPLYQNGDNYLDWILKTSALLEYPVEVSQTFGDSLQFEMVIIEFGLCFMYNSKIAIHSNPSSWSLKPQDIPANETLTINPSITAPTVTVNNLISDYVAYFHGANEIPELSVNGLVVGPSTFSYIYLRTENVWTPSEVKDLKISQRKCRYPDESNLEHSPVYSYNLCRIECRIKLCLKLCKCIPYYYRRIGNETICNPIQMQCWLRNKKSITYLVDENNNAVCSCLQTCDIDSVLIANSEISNWPIGTNIQWKMPIYPKIRYKRTLIFGFINLLVQIGGVAGLMLGFSILSLIEIIFFLTLRFFWGVFQDRLFQV